MTFGTVFHRDHPFPGRDALFPDHGGYGSRGRRQTVNGCSCPVALRQQKQGEGGRSTPDIQRRKKERFPKSRVRSRLRSWARIYGFIPRASQRWGRTKVNKPNTRECARGPRLSFEAPHRQAAGQRAADISVSQSHGAR